MHNIITYNNVKCSLLHSLEDHFFFSAGVSRHIFPRFAGVSFPQLFLIEADLTSAKRIIQKQKVLILTCFLLASKSPYSVVLETKIPWHLLKATTQCCSMVGLIYSAALCRALVLAGCGSPGLVVVVWWSSRAIWSCDDGCVKGLVGARMFSGHSKMHKKLFVVLWKPLIKPDPRFWEKAFVCCALFTFQGALNSPDPRYNCW